MSTRNSETKNYLLSQFLYSIRETFTDNELSQIIKTDPQRILAWFIIDCFQHNLDLQAEKIIDHKLTMKQY